MPRGHPGLPRPPVWQMRKGELLEQLASLDHDAVARDRALSMEATFRQSIDAHVESLPADEAKFAKFFTSPYVLMMHARKNSYSKVSEIEHDILPAKLFSSLETSAGRAVEAITLQQYGWGSVPSGMHTQNSALDGKRLVGDILKVATLKSGPRCLNDEMSENFADAILQNVTAWANEADVSKVEFSYGVLYGTQKLSNKKDWHILRNLEEKHGLNRFSELPAGQWSCKFKIDGVSVEAAIRIGKDWWSYIGGDLCLTELAVALIRACVAPGDLDPPNYQYTIQDLRQIVSMQSVPKDFNPSILQQSQIPWYFFFMRHFCDKMIESAPCLGND